MDPISDLPPTHLSDHFTTASPPLTSHPPYAEMITAAISGLKDKDGSSRQAISKYIEKEFTHLPPTHSTLLTHHLKRLKNLGQLVMVKHSYMLPVLGSAQGGANNLDFSSGDGSDNNNNVLGSGSVLTKRRPGRPPKLKAGPGLGVPNVGGYNAGGVSSYEPQFQYHGSGGGGQDVGDNYGSGSGFQGNSVGGSGTGAKPLFASLGLGDGGAVVPLTAVPGNTNTPVVVKRGRGRPPKSAGASGGHVVGSGASGSHVAGSGGGGGDIVVSGSDGGGGEVHGVEEGSGRPVRKENGVRVKRGRGRPRRVGFGAVTVPLSGNFMRPRGRPKRVARPNVVVNGGPVEGGLGKRRGRPSRDMITDSIGKPFGSLSKGGPGTAVLVTDPRQLVVYQELDSRYKHLQSKVKQVASMVRPCIDPDYGSTALGALQELENLAAEVIAHSHGQTHEPGPSH